MTAPASDDFRQYRGIYLKRIPTYSFPLMLEVMEGYGVSPGLVLKNAGLDASAVARDGTLVSFLQALKFLRNLIANSPQPDIGLEIGSRYQISTYGVLGYAMMSAATWGEALRLGRRYYKVASSMVHLDMKVDENRDYLTLVARPFYAELTDIEPFTVEKLFASLVAVSEPLLARPGRPRRVSFTWPEPAYAQRYREIFRCPVEFGASENQFEIALDVLKQPLLLANTVTAEMGRKMCEEYLTSYEQADDSLRRRVSDILLGSPGGIPDMETVASRLQMSSRTLRRSLQTEGCSFQELSDQVRHDLSKHYLRKSSLSLDDIAELVGFTESTNFRRAFKRWQGMPPAQYRRQIE